MSYIWLGVIIFSLIIEALTVQMIAIWFAPAALVSMIVSLLGAPLWLQIILFIAVSALCVATLYKKLKDNIKNKSEKTNIDALIGEIGFVEEEIPMYKPGRVSVKGMSWKAVSDTPLIKGDMVRVLEVNGVTVKCEKASKQNAESTAKEDLEV